MKKLLLVLYFMVAAIGYGSATDYAIEFQTGNGEGTGISTGNAMSGIVSSTDYVSGNVLAATNAY
jgi:hypothetical protein